MPPPPSAPLPEPSRDEVAAIAALAECYRTLRREIGKVIIGQDDVVEELLTGLFARGHVLAGRGAGPGQDACSSARSRGSSASRSAASSSRPT